MKHVAIETAMIDLFTYSVLLSARNSHTHVPRKFHSDSLNNLEITLKYARNLTEYFKYVAMETTLIVLLRAREDNIYIP